jgi:hypothetical protein
MRELDRISIDWLCSHALIATLAFYLLMAVRQFSPEIWLCSHKSYGSHVADFAALAFHSFGDVETK